MISKYDDKVLVEAYIKYGSTTRAAKNVGCSYETVRRACKRNNIVLDGRRLNNKGDRGGGGSPRKVLDAEIIAEAKTMTRVEIAQKHGVDVCNVDRKLKRLGIKCKKGVGRGSGSSYRERCNCRGAEYDRSINLKNVINKFNGVCQICGKPVDINDRDGNVIGKMYPTIDQIKPLSKGGGHTWDNVQLAHLICNSRKCDGRCLNGDIT